jgi:hypothetical protein
MTCVTKNPADIISGVYKLCFKGTTEVYIGQSLNIYSRFSRHLRDMGNRSASAKVLRAFDTYGAPYLEILCICPKKDLETLEVSFIQKYNSIAMGFNTTLGSPGGLNGEYYPVSKYSKPQILEALECLVSPLNSTKYVSETLGIPTRTIKAILGRESHHWIDSEHPGLIDSINLVNARRSHTPNPLLSNVSLVSPLGETIIIGSTLTAFAREHLLCPSALSKLLKGKIKSTKGWHLSL